MGGNHQLPGPLDGSRASLWGHPLAGRQRRGVPSRSLAPGDERPFAGDRISLDPHDLIKGRQIRGSWGGSSLPDDALPRFAALYREGRLPLEKLITHRYPLEGINEALDALDGGHVGRPLIEIDPALGSATAPKPEESLA